VLGLSREEVEEQFAAILEFSGVGDFIDTQVKFYSSGMYVRLAFAIAVHTDPDILLVDEVLAVGDEQFQEKCLAKIREFQTEGRTIIIVSHAMDQISSLCDRVVVMDKGKLVYDGIPVTAIERFRKLLAENAVGQARPDQISRALEIRSVEILGAGGKDIAQLRAGDDVNLRVDVEMLRPIERWAIGFSVDSSLGQIALASNTDMLDIDLAPLTASRDVSISFTTDGLSPGRYSINVNASGVSEPTSHGLMNGAEFEILGDVLSVGPVATSVRIT
jgi:ABC-2 type transport system ATP-binding protein